MFLNYYEGIPELQFLVFTLKESLRFQNLELIKHLQERDEFRRECSNRVDLNISFKN